MDAPTPEEISSWVEEALRDLQAAALAHATVSQTDYGDQTRKLRRAASRRLQAAAKRYHEVVVSVSFLRHA